MFVLEFILLEELFVVELELFTLLLLWMPLSILLELLLVVLFEVFPRSGIVFISIIMGSISVKYLSYYYCLCCGESYCRDEVVSFPDVSGSRGSFGNIS